jgi:hypothetical protein
MRARLRDLLNSEPLDDPARLEAQEALDALTARDEVNDEASKQRAMTKLKHVASETWWKVAAPVLTTFLSAELKRQAGLPPV